MALDQPAYRVGAYVIAPLVATRWRGVVNLGLDAVNRSLGIDEKLAVEFTKHIGAQRLDTLGLFRLANGLGFFSLNPGKISGRFAQGSQVGENFPWAQGLQPCFGALNRI